MVGSKKAWQTYLGLDPKTASATWNKLGLLSPAEWVRAQDFVSLTQLLLRLGSFAKLAEYTGTSEAFIKSYLGQARTKAPGWTEEKCRELFAKYRSTRFVARMCDMLESDVRREVERLGLELAELADYSEGGNSNAKGRRAELDFAALRGDKILRDLNKDVGPTADYDFDDTELGKVNVKSSRRFKFKAYSRSGDPYFWKVGCRGKEKADYFAVMCYDEKGEKLIGHVLIKTADVVSTSSTTLKLSHLTKAE